MRLGNVYFDDECAVCGNVLECDLCKDGHGIGRERTRMVEMVRCQFEHYEQTIRKQRKENKENE